MKQKILIEEHGKTIFKGKVLNMPVVQSKVIEKSIELFDDEDPCIIHTSFILKHFAEELLTLFEKTNQSVILGKDYKRNLKFLDVPSVEDITITLL